MDITIVNPKDSQFKIKGKTGTLLTLKNGVRIISGKDATEKELLGPGEYEVAGISVIGTKHENNIAFIYEVDNVRICHLEGCSDVLPEGKLSLLGDIDVLLLPVCSKSIEMMQQIESYYTVPFAYESPEELDKFLKDSGLTVERLPKLSLKKEDIIEEQSGEIVVLDMKNG